MTLVKKLFMNSHSSPYPSRLHPDYYLRAEWHDYKSRCFYLVTFNKAGDAPRFSDITGTITPNGADAKVNLTPTGEIIEEKILNLPKVFPFVEINRMCVMPDHVHMVIFVKKKTDIHLGEIIRRLKSDCSKQYKARFPKSTIAMSNGSLFHKGFNDRIVYKTGQLKNFKEYVANNPKRYLIKKTHPEFFDCCRNILIEDEEYSVYGNFLLLRDPDKEAVVVSSRHSEEKKKWKAFRYEEVARCGGVYVSPFISDDEKYIRKTGIENGVKIIRIVENGFPERYSPKGFEADLCAEGRLLIIAPNIHNTRKTSVHRHECLSMNELAERIATAEGSMALMDAIVRAGGRI